MKKGQKVRVLADGRVGIVADTHFINWGGKRLVQCQVKFPRTKGDAPWFPAEQLTTALVEKASIEFKGEKGALFFTYSCNHDTHRTSLEIIGDPENLEEHRGTHAFLAAALIAGLEKTFAQPSRKTVIHKHGIC